MTVNIQNLTVSDVQFLTESECRDVIGELAWKIKDTLSSRQIDILEECENRVQEDKVESYDDFDDGQPDWEQEWADFGEVYDDSYNCI